MCKRKKLEHFLTPYTKRNSKWIKDLNVRPETRKLLEENKGRTPDDINQSNILYDPPPRIMEIKTKVNKWDLIKLKNFYTAKETLSKVKRQPSEWEKIITNEQLIRINFQNTQVAHTTQYQKNKHPNQKVRKRHISKEDIQMANKQVKRYLTLLIIREMQIKTTMRYYLTPVRIAIIKESTNNKCWRECGDMGMLLHCWLECKLIQPLWKTIRRFP